MQRLRGLALLAVLLLAASTRAETLAIPGLSAPATVYTDALGIPHIVAETLEDAARAQGYVHARDRFFQMDVSRHRAEGTLAELTGKAVDVLGSDSLLRPWDLRAAAVRSAELLGDEERALVQAYADGVNAWLATHPLPGEYAELELTHVRPWSVIDTCLVGELQGFRQVSESTYEPGFTARRETYIAAGQAADPPFDGAALADVDAGSIAPLDPAATVPDAGGPVPLAGEAKGRAVERPSPLSSAVIELARRHGQALASAPTSGWLTGRGGSNAWGVAAEKSATGTPLVATDGHISLAAPSLGYEVHLIVRGDPEVGQIHLGGLSFAGIPLVVEGQTERLAWGATDAYFDRLDYFADRLLRDAPACPARFCIESAGALHPVESSIDAFRRNVTGDGIPDNLVELLSGPQLRVPFRSFGQIVEIDAPDFLDGTGEAETTALTVQCTLAHGTRDIRALLGFARAQDVFDFREALKDFDVASVNMVVADTSGNLAYFTSGEVPLRADLEAGTPLDRPELVRDGSGPGNWVPDPARSDGQSIPFAVIPFDEMPQLVNPPAGFVASSNNDPLGLLADGDPLNSFRPSKPGAVYYLGSSFDPGSYGGRAGRITELLRQKVDAVEPMTVDDMKRFQGDTVLRQAELVVPFIVSAFENAQLPDAPPELAAFTQDPALIEAVGRLAAWDFSTPTGIPEGYDASDVDGAPAGTVPPEEVTASIAATIYHTFLAPFVDLTLRRAIDTIDPSLPRVGTEPTFIAGLYHVLSAQPFTGLGGSGLDLFPGPAGLSAAERRDVALLQALRDGLDRLASPEFANAFGGSTSQDDYRWGKLHRLTLQHPLGGDRNLPPAAGFEDLGPGLPGLSRDGASGALNAGFNPSLDAEGFFGLDGFDFRLGVALRDSAGAPGRRPRRRARLRLLRGGLLGRLREPGLRLAASGLAHRRLPRGPGERSGRRGLSRRGRRAAPGQQGAAELCADHERGRRFSRQDPGQGGHRLPRGGREGRGGRS